MRRCKSVMKNFRLTPQQWEKFDSIPGEVGFYPGFGAIVVEALELLYLERVVKEGRIRRARNAPADWPNYGQPFGDTSAPLPANTDTVATLATSPAELPAAAPPIAAKPPRPRRSRKTPSVNGKLPKQPPKTPTKRKEGKQSGKKRV